MARSVATAAGESASTRRIYGSIWRRHLAFLAHRGRTVADADAGDLEAFLAGQQRLPTAVRYAALLRRVYACAAQEGWRRGDPSARLPRRWFVTPARAPAAALAPDDLERIRAAWREPGAEGDIQARALVAVVLAAGLRARELRELRLDQVVEADYGLEIRLLRREPTDRHLPVGEPWASALRRWLAVRRHRASPGLCVFCGVRQDELATATLHRAVRDVLVPLFPDDRYPRLSIGLLRATFAHEQARDHETPRVQAKLGHRRASSTTRLLRGSTAAEESSHR